MISQSQVKEFTKENPSQYDKVLEQLPFLFGETKDVLTKARQLTDSEAFLTALDSLEVLTNRLADSLPETTLDLAQLPAVPYYTGMMFKVFGDKVPDAFVSGGRYDKLFERFGATELTAVGWAIDVDSVYQAVHDDVEFEVTWMTSNQITIALTKGRIEKDTVKLLEKAGFDMSFMADKGRNLIFESPDKRFRFLLVKAPDVTSPLMLDTVSQILGLSERMFWLNIRQAIWKC